MIKVSIEISARHVHLSQKDFEILFGKNYQVNYLKPLSQKGQYSCKETVDLITKTSELKKVRLIYPNRKQTQIEISKTDAYKLGLNPPIRRSGKIAKSEKITIVGPKGKIKLNEGVIIAARHIHTSPEDAKKYNLADDQKVSVAINGDRALTFHNVIVRIDPSFVWRFQIDTDEANAAGIENNAVGEVIINNTDNSYSSDSFSKTWQGIPREKIDWYPTIDYAKCSNCLSCVSFCKKGVYENKSGKVEATKPYNCVVGCTGCDGICPNGAISHPPKEYLDKIQKKFKKDIDNKNLCNCGCK